MNSKQYFEAYSIKKEVLIIHYHANNRLFSDKAVINSVNTQRQKILLWSQRPPPKRNSGKEDQVPSRTSKKTDTACQINMDLHNRSEPVALCATKCKRNK